MADLYIDMDGLDKTRENLDHIGDLMKDPLNLMNDLADSATDIDELKSKLKDFGDEWDYGIGRLGKYTKGVGEALGEIKKVFTQLEDDLAGLFDQKK